MITEENKIKLIKRTKSFLWRMLMLGAVAGINFVGANLELFDLPIEVVGILGLVLGEISKQINNQLSSK